MKFWLHSWYNVTLAIYKQISTQSILKTSPIWSVIPFFGKRQKGNTRILPARVNNLSRDPSAYNLLHEFCAALPVTSFLRIQVFGKGVGPSTYYVRLFLAFFGPTYGP